MKSRMSCRRFAGLRRCDLLASGISRHFRLHDPEIVFRLKKKNHAGFVIASPDPNRVRYLQDEYTRRIYTDFFAKLPPPDKPTS
jgi:hypothetical protein